MAIGFLQVLFESSAILEFIYLSESYLFFALEMYSGFDMVKIQMTINLFHPFQSFIQDLF